MKLLHYTIYIYFILCKIEKILYIYSIMGKIDKNIKKYCINCEKQLIIKSNRDIIKKRFCSHKCSSYFTTIERQKKDPTLLIKFRLAGLTSDSNRKKGLKLEKHPKWKGGNQLHFCKLCNSEFFIPIYRSNKGYGLFCSRKCWKSHCENMRIKTNCLNCGKEISYLPKRNRKYCSCSCRMIHLLPKQKFKGTDIELKLKQFLIDKNIQFEYQPRIKDIVNADFFIKPNIVIFADGDYWHSLPNAMHRDIIVNKKLKENNYLVLRFKGTEINKDFDLVQNKIMETYNALKQ